MTRKQWPLSKFVHYCRNPHRSDCAVDRVATSIQEFGFKILVLARSNDQVVDGGPHYVDVIVSGRQPLTGRDAVLEASGETFEQTQAAPRLSIPEVR
jgi:hypothetical protein